MLARIRYQAGFLANLTFTLSSVMGVLLMTPLIMKNYGQGKYLLWTLANAVCALLFIVDFGITSVVARKFIEIFEKPIDFSIEIWRGFLTFHVKILCVGSLLVSLTFAVLWYQGAIIIFSAQNLLIFIFTLIATLATILSHQQVLKFQVGGLYSRGLTIIAIVRVIETIIVILLLYWSISFTLVTSAVAAIHIFQLFFLASDATTPSAPQAHELPTIRRFEQLQLKFTSSVLYSASSVLGIHATLIVQSLFLAPTQVLVVVISRMISSPIRIFADSLAIGSFDKYIRRSLANIEMQTHHKHLPVQLWSALFGFSAFYVLLINFTHKFVINILSDGQSIPNLLLLNLFCAATLLDGSVVIYTQVAISRGSLGQTGIRYFSITAFCLILLVPCIQIFGVYGGAISIIFCDLLFLFTELNAKSPRIAS